MKHADFSDGPHRADSCLRWCKVHWYWSFDQDMHVPYPWDSYWKQTNGWAHALVHIGPPAYYPKKPTQEQMTNMHAHCPHTQGDLTCNTCLRHTFRPMEI